MTRAHELYSRFETDTDSNDDPGVCVVRATRSDQWRNERQDTLTFDAVSGLLRSWDIQTGLPSKKRSVQFQFNDYRQLGAIKFPYYVYFDFNDTVFRYTSVVHNKHLPDSEFREKPALP
jgi:hypothetical protein